MGNRLDRKLAPADSDETAACEQRTAEEPVPETEITGTQEAVQTLNEEVVAGELVTCVAECKNIEPPEDAEPQPVAKKTAAPVQPTPSVSICEPPPPEPEPPACIEAQLDLEQAPEPMLRPEAELLSESVQVPAKAAEQQIDMLAPESCPEPGLPSPPFIDLAVPDITPQPVDSPPIPDPVSADVPVTEELRGSAEAAGTIAFELDKSEETLESLEKAVEVEAAENVVQLVSNANEESISGLLQNLALKENDLIPSDAEIPEDAPITDMSMSTELI